MERHAIVTQALRHTRRFLVLHHVGAITERKGPELGNHHSSVKVTPNVTELKKSAGFNATSILQKLDTHPFAWVSRRISIFA
jgi:hypothetical protein